MQHIPPQDQPEGSPPALSAARPDADRANDRQSRSILIVEDDVGMSTMLTMALEDSQYAVDVAANGAEALEMLQRNRPHLILLDLRMPVMDGPTFIRRLRAERPNDVPPIIIMTAYRDVEPDVLAFGLPTVTKPMKLDLLLPLIEQYAARN